MSIAAENRPGRRGNPRPGLQLQPVAPRRPKAREEKSAAPKQCASGEEMAVEDGAKVV
jgi:hypothetical protein